MSRPEDSATGTQEYPFLTGSTKKKLKYVYLQQELSANNREKHRAYKHVLA